MSPAAPPPASPDQPQVSPARRRLLSFLLGLVLLRGLLYTALFPPWQHYDEPTHFEYVRLIAERGRLPRPDDYSLEMRRLIAASMQAAGFWRDVGGQPIDFWSDKPPAIGISELSHPPLYYAAVALPQLLVAHQGVDVQLYLARGVSVLLNVAVVASAYGVVVELFPRRPWLPVAVATVVAFLPPLSELMSAVNNDAGANATTALFLWASARLLRRGPTTGRVVGLLLLAAASAAVKSSAGVVAGAALAALALASVPHKYAVRLGVGFAVLGLGCCVFLFDGSAQAAHWYSESPPGGVNRTNTETPWGESALVLAAKGGREPLAVVQELVRHEAYDLRGHTVTVGAWFRAADGSGGFAALNLDDGPSNHFQRVEVTADWQFHAFTATVGLDAPGVAVQVLLTQQNPAKRVYVDGVILADGQMPVGTPPQIDTAEAETGQWGTTQVRNLLRNGSAETAWPGLTGRIGNLTLFQRPLSWVFHSAWEWRRTGWVYFPESLLLFRSFWGRFGWNHLGLPDAFFYPLGLVALLAVLGLGAHLLRQRRTRLPRATWQKRARVLFAVILLVSWGDALLRIHPVLTTRHVFWPVARYAFVSIIPTATLLCLGLTEIVPRGWRRAVAVVGLLGLLALEWIAIWTVILPYYYG